MFILFFYFALNVSYSLSMCMFYCIPTVTDKHFQGNGKAFFNQPMLFYSLFSIILYFFYFFYLTHFFYLVDTSEYDGSFAFLFNCLNTVQKICWMLPRLWSWTAWRRTSSPPPCWTTFSSSSRSVSREP